MHLTADLPAVAVAPMDGVTDAVMRTFLGEVGAFSYGVTEFVRVSAEVLPARFFRKTIPELAQNGHTPSGLPVIVQILGGHPERMALSAAAAVQAGARAIDINFGCPAPTVNRHDGGATLLQYPDRIEAIVRAVREAINVPVSAKLRLGWDNIEAIHENALRAAAGGADWITIHARTRTQGYQPPVFWRPIGQVREALQIPVVANGDIWSFEDFLECERITGCQHYMLGRSALSNPRLSHQIAAHLDLPHREIDDEWTVLMRRYAEIAMGEHGNEKLTLQRLKQWAKFGEVGGRFPHFAAVKRTDSLEAFFAGLIPPVGPSREEERSREFAHR